jgi:hypothetical protein
MFSKIIVHRVGNKINGESLTLSGRAEAGKEWRNC